MGKVAPELGVDRRGYLATRADQCENFVGAETRATRDTHFFNPAVQLTTIVIGAEDA